MYSCTNEHNAATLLYQRSVLLPYYQLISLHSILITGASNIFRKINNGVSKLRQDGNIFWYILGTLMLRTLEIFLLTIYLIMETVFADSRKVSNRWKNMSCKYCFFPPPVVHTQPVINFTLVRVKAFRKIFSLAFKVWKKKFIEEKVLLFDTKQYL